MVDAVSLQNVEISLVLQWIMLSCTLLKGPREPVDGTGNKNSCHSSMRTSVQTPSAHKQSG